MRPAGPTRRAVLAAGVGLAVAAACRRTRPGAGRVVPVRYGTAPAQHVDVRLPAGAGPHPVVAVLHGGFWLAQYDLELMTPVCEALAADGIATWNVEYRRVGEEGGGWPGTFADVGLALDQVRELAPALRLDLGRVVTLGHSAGGHLALWLAARRRIPADSPLAAGDALAVRGAVSLAGIPDLRHAATLGFAAVPKLMGGMPDAVPDRYRAGSPAELLPLGVPQRLVHGRDDRIVAPALAEEYVAAARARGDDATFVPVADAGHFEPIDPTSRAWGAVRAELRALLA